MRRSAAALVLICLSIATTACGGGVSERVSLQVTPRAQAFDQPMRIDVRGLR